MDKKSFIEGVEEFRRSPGGKAFIKRMRDRAQELDKWAEDLATKGIDAQITCHQVPVQVEGRLADGRPFYFRCRWDTCSLSVGEDAVARPDWTTDVSRWDEFAAGWLEPDEVAEVFDDLLGRYEEGVKSIR